MEIKNSPFEKQWWEIEYLTGKTKQVKFQSHLTYYTKINSKSITALNIILLHYRKFTYKKIRIYG